MKLKKHRTEGTCDAMRCTAAATFEGEHGEALCERHAVTYAESNPAHPSLLPDAVVEVSPDETEDPRAIVAQAQADGLDTLAELRSFVVEGPEDLEFASDFVNEAKARWRALDEKEKEITRPLNEAAKRTRDLFRAPKQVFADVEAAVKEAVARYHLALEAKREAAMGRAAEAAAAGDHEGAGAALASIEDSTRTAGLSVRTKWTWELVDVDAVPREFLAVDAAKVQAAAEAFGRGEGPEVPGVRFVTQKVVAATGRAGR